MGEGSHGYGTDNPGSASAKDLTPLSNGNNKLWEYFPVFHCLSSEVLQRSEGGLMTNSCTIIRLEE